MRNGWLLGGLGLLMVFVVGIGSAQASEGRIVLRNRSVSCEGISIWRDTVYRITGRCAGLTYPYQERLSQYVLWVQQDGQSQPSRVGNIEVGYFDGQSQSPFSQVFITVEAERGPRNPSDNVIASGSLQPFAFSGGDTGSPTVPGTISTPTPTSAPSPIGGSIVSNLGAALRRLVVLLIVLLVVAVIIIVGYQVVASRRASKQQ